MLIVAVCLMVAVLAWPTRPGEHWSRKSRADPLGGAEVENNPTGSAPLLARPGEMPEAEGNPRPDSGAPSVAIADVASCAQRLAWAMRSGCALAHALEVVASTADGATAADLRRVCAALQWGRTMRQAWAYAAPVWQSVAVACEVADQAGASPAASLLATAAQLRATQAAAQEAAAARAGVLLVIPLGLLFLPAFMCLTVVPLVTSMLGSALP